MPCSLMMALCSSAELVGPILLCSHLPHSCPPFATRVLAGDGGFAIRFSLYALIQVITGLSFLLMTRQLARHQLLRHDTPAPIINDSVLHSSVTTTMFLYRFPSPLPRPGHTHAGSSYRRPPGFCALPDRLLDRVIGSRPRSGVNKSAERCRSERKALIPRRSAARISRHHTPVTRIPKIPTLRPGRRPEGVALRAVRLTARDEPGTFSAWPVTSPRGMGIC
jgi:hypothetical protein